MNADGTTIVIPCGGPIPKDDPVQGDMVSKKRFPTLITRCDKSGNSATVKAGHEHSLGVKKC